MLFVLLVLPIVAALIIRACPDTSRLGRTRNYWSPNPKVKP